jgi:hypothetical protein
MHVSQSSAESQSNVIAQYQTTRIRAFWAGYKRYDRFSTD